MSLCRLTREAAPYSRSSDSYNRSVRSARYGRFVTQQQQHEAMKHLTLLFDAAIGMNDKMISTTMFVFSLLPPLPLSLLGRITATRAS